MDIPKNAYLRIISFIFVIVLIIMTTSCGHSLSSKSYAETAVSYIMKNAYAGLSYQIEDVYVKTDKSSTTYSSDPDGLGSVLFSFEDTVCRVYVKYSAGIDGALAEFQECVFIDKNGKVDGVLWMSDDSIRNTLNSSENVQSSDYSETIIAQYLIGYHSLYANAFPSTIELIGWDHYSGEMFNNLPSNSKSNNGPVTQLQKASKSEVDELLQGEWTFQSCGTSFYFTDGKVGMILNGELFAGGLYTIDTDASVIYLQITASDKSVPAKINYVYSNGAIGLYNDNGQYFYKMASAEMKPTVETTNETISDTQQKEFETTTASVSNTTEQKTQLQNNQLTNTQFADLMDQLLGFWATEDGNLLYFHIFKPESGPIQYLFWATHGFYSEADLGLTIQSSAYRDNSGIIHFHIYQEYIPAEAFSQPKADGYLLFDCSEIDKGTIYWKSIMDNYHYSDSYRELVWDNDVEWTRCRYLGSEWSDEFYNLNKPQLSITENDITTDETPYSPGDYIVTAEGSLRLRESHSTASQHIMSVPSGTVLTITEIYTDFNATTSEEKYWGKTYYKGWTAWVALKYLSPLGN